MAALADALGADRPAVICRELTKTHEEIIRGSLSELASWATRPVLGEITLVVGGARAAARAAVADLAPAQVAAMVAAAEQGGRSRTEAITSTAARLGLRRRAVYDAVVSAKHQQREQGSG